MLPRPAVHPVILAVSEGVIKYAGLNYITAIAREAAQSVTAGGGRDAENKNESVRKRWESRQQRVINKRRLL